MPAHRLSLTVLPGVYAVARLPAAAPLPKWARGDVVSVTGTAEETSIVCLAECVPVDVRHEPGWSCLRVAGPLDFALVGVLASLVGPLADAGVSVFAVSTFDTDYLLVREGDLARARQALLAAGHDLA